MFKFWWLPSVLSPVVTFFVYMAGTLNIACNSRDFKIQTNRAIIIGKTLLSNKHLNLALVKA